MKPVERSEILELGEYEEVRESFRRRLIELKRLRRVALGANVTVLFENHDTVLYQIQEMIRTERITREDAILHELETYNELLPARDELSATIFIEYPEREERERMLAAMTGIEGGFYMVVDGTRIAARNETRGALPGRTTAVHYVKYPVGEVAARAIRGGKANVVVGVEHAAYNAETALVRRTLAEIAYDLG